MNDARDPRTRLVAETWQGDWSGGPAARMAARAAASARRRRNLHRTAVALASISAASALLFLGVQPPPVRPAASLPVASPGYEIISDEEFVTLLRDRPLLVLPQEAGAKRFVVLDR